MAKENEEKVEPAPVVTSVNCKGCKKSFKSNSIQKHLNQTKKNCLSHYSQGDLKFLKEQSKKHSTYKEKLWKQQNKSRIAETSSNCYHEKKKEKKLEQQHSLIQEQKNFYKNDFNDFINSNHKKAISSNIQSNNYYQSYYSKEFKKIQKYLISEEEKTEMQENVKRFKKEIQTLYQTINNLIYNTRTKANALKEKQDWEDVSKIYLTLIPNFFKNEIPVFSVWKKLHHDLEIELKAIWKFQINLNVECQGCQKSYETNTILKHLVNSKYCYSKYTPDQLNDLKKNSGNLTHFKRTVWNKTELPKKKKKYYQNNKDKFKKWKQESDERHFLHRKKKRLDLLELRKKQYENELICYLDNEKAYYEIHIQTEIEEMKKQVSGKDLHDQLINIELQIQAKFVDFDKISTEAREKTSQIICKHDLPKIDRSLENINCSYCTGAVDRIYSFINKEITSYKRLSKFEELFGKVFHTKKTIAKENNEIEVPSGNLQLNFEKILKDSGSYKNPNEKLEVEIDTTKITLVMKDEKEGTNIISSQGNFPV